MALKRGWRTVLASALAALTVTMAVAETAAANWRSSGWRCGQGCYAYYEYKCSWGTVWRRTVMDNNPDGTYRWITYSSWVNTRMPCSG